MKMNKSLFTFPALFCAVLLSAGCDDGDGDKCGKGEIKAEDGACLCDNENGFYGEAGACEQCSGDGKVIKENACVCDDSQNYYSEDDGATCVLCSGDGKAIKDNACVCDETQNYYSEDDGATCLQCSGDGKVIKDNTCVCDESSFVDDGNGGCVCKDAGKVVVDNACVCDESLYNDVEGSCVCKGVIIGDVCAVTGAIFKFGNYPQADSTPSAINWRVLDIDTTNHKIFLLSENILSAGPFSSSGSNEWKTSPIASWLNGAFLDASFSDSEKGAILETALEDVDDSVKVFLLSKPEVEGSYPITRVAKVTPYAVTHFKEEYEVPYGIDECNDPSFDCAAAWWLRSKEESFTSYVKRDGDVARANVSQQFGIRPAMWIQYSE